jgi:hypothetical protein
VCDADLAGQHDRRSTIGCIGYLNDCIIYGNSSTLKGMVTSSTESESWTIFETVKVAVFVEGWLADAKMIFTKPSLIFNDNKSAITILGNRSNSGLSKHFDTRLRYVTWLIKKGRVEVYHLERLKNGADFLTHSCSQAEFNRCIALIYGEANTAGLLRDADSAKASEGGDWKSRTLFKVKGPDFTQLVAVLYHG